MLVDVKQHRDNVTVSYVKEDGQIDVIKMPAKFNNWTICSEEDPDKSDKWRNWDEKPVKLVPGGWRFKDSNIRDFLVKQIPKNTQNLIFSYNLPNLYSYDIEIDITDCEGFPEAYLADWPIASISITAPNLSTVIYYTDPSHRYDRSEEARVSLEDEINEYFKEYPKAQALIKKYTPDNRLKYHQIFFETETEMLSTFLNHQMQFYHTLIGWNTKDFDQPYIKNRCAKLGIDRTISSPTRELDDRYQHASHRLEIDYMEVCDKYCYDIWKMSMSLEYFASECLGVGKVNYEGSFLDLYNNPRLFQLYSAIDTIVVQMIHMQKNYLGSHLMKAFYAKIPVLKAYSTMAVGDALFWDQLNARNKKFLDSRTKEEKERLQEDDEGYEGGFVVTPRYKVADWIAMIDLKSLYPSICQSLKCSPDTLIKVNATKEECFAAIKQGHIVSMNNTIYDGFKEGIIPATMGYLINERYHFKDLGLYLFQNVTPVLEKIMEIRGIDKKLVA